MATAPSFFASIAGLVLVVVGAGCAPSPAPASPRAEVVVTTAIDPRVTSRENLVPNALAERAAREERSAATLVYDGAASQPGVHRPMAITITSEAVDSRAARVVADPETAIATPPAKTGASVVEATVVRSDAELRAILRRNRAEGPLTAPR